MSCAGLAMLDFSLVMGHGFTGQLLGPCCVTLVGSFASLALSFIDNWLSAVLCKDSVEWCT